MPGRSKAADKTVHLCPSPFCIAALIRGRDREAKLYSQQTYTLARGL